MRNIKLTIEYDGTRYAGWQFQPGCKTIQATIEQALKKILKEKVNLIASGRTDAGVHAEEQVANFRTKSGLSQEKIKNALNHNLPGDIVIKACHQAPLNFNARFDAKSKVYRYVLHNGPTRIAINRQYVYRVPYFIDVELMKKEAKLLLGKKNFKSFHASGRKVKDFTRCIKRIDIKKDKGDFITIDIEANGFLYNMVRNIVGTLVEVGRLKRPVGSTRDVLKARDRSFAGPTMPAKGLCLIKVRY